LRFCLKLTGYAALQAYYEKFVEQIITKNNKYPIFWEEVFDNAPNGTLQYPTTVVNVWFSNNSKIQEVVQAGYQALFSTPWF
jgi:hypothetical protein